MLLTRVAILFMAEKSFAPLCLEGFQSPEFGSEVFAKQFTSLLENYGLDLKEEADLDPEPRVAAVLVLYCAGFIVDKICEACHEKLQIQSIQVDGYCAEFDGANSDLDSVDGNKEPGYLTHLRCGGLSAEWRALSDATC